MEEAFGNTLVECKSGSIGPDHEQFQTYDGNHATLVDEGQEIILVVLQGCSRLSLPDEVPVDPEDRDPKEEDDDL